MGVYVCEAMRMCNVMHHVSIDIQYILYIIYYYVDIYILYIRTSYDVYSKIHAKKIINDLGAVL